MAKSRSRNFWERLKKLSHQRAYRCRNCQWRGLLEAKSSRLRLILKDKILSRALFLFLLLLMAVFLMLALSLIKMLPRANPSVDTGGVVVAVPAPAVSSQSPVQAKVQPEQPAIAPEEAIRNLIEKWLKSWQSGDLETYRSCYAPDFNARGMSLDEWTANKASVISSSRNIEIKIDQLEIIAGEMEATASFMQHYRSSASNDSGKKTLELKKIDGEWKIYRENM